MVLEGAMPSIAKSPRPRVRYCNNAFVISNHPPVLLQLVVSYSYLKKKKKLVVSYDVSSWKSAPIVLSFFVKIKKKIIICRSPWAFFAGPCALRLGWEFWEFRRRVNLKSLLVRKIENSEPTLLFHTSDYVQLIGWNFQSVCDNFWLAANRLRCLNRNDLSRAPIPSYRATVTVLKYRIVSKWAHCGTI